MTTVSWRCYQYEKQFRTVYYACTFLPTAVTTGTTTTAAATANAKTTNKSAATTVLHNYINENQNCDDEYLDQTNSKPHLSFPLLLHTLFSAINQCK